MRHYLFRIAMTLMLAIPTVALAEKPVATLETVTVTAERFPVQEKKSARFVTVVSAEELQESGANNVVDALKRRGGFGYKAFGPLGINQGGMSSEVSIRGLEDGELVLINGVPIQGAAGHGYDLNTLPIDLIERVEILKGAASTLYGADAMTGVINIITKKPPSESKTKAAVEFGSETYHNHTLSYLSPKLNIGLNYQHLGAQEEISKSFSGNYHYASDPTNKYTFNLNLNPIQDLYFDFLTSYYEADFKRISDEDGSLEKGTDQKHSKSFADLRYETADFKAKAFGTYDEMRRDEYTSDDPEDKNQNYNYGIEGDYRFDLSSLNWVVGTDLVHRAADYDNQYGYHDRNDYSLFSQLKKDFFNRLTLTAGAREQFVDGEEGTKDYDRFLPSLDLVFAATKRLNIFANAGKAFRAPTFNQLYYESAFMVGNPDLDPEEGWTYELGSKWDSSTLRLRLAGFYMSYEEKIEIDRTNGYPLTYYNAGDYETKGIEWELDLYPFVDRRGWLAETSFYTAGYWADPTAKDTDGDTYQAGAKFQSRLGVVYLTDTATLDLNCRMLYERERALKDYTVFNLYSKYRIGKGYLSFAVDNIFDQEVQVSGDLRDDASSQYAYYEVGRLLKVGYAIEF
jgi:outer membrane receptor protein involved in Fe transport